MELYSPHENLDESLLGLTKSHNKDIPNKSAAIILSIIGTIIFITLVAVFDLIRNVINNRYADQTEEITAKRANRSGLKVNIIFALVCVLICVVSVYILAQYL